MRLKPLGDSILAKRVDAQEKSPGGIVLPDTAKEKPKRGIVVNVGNGKLLDNGQRIPLQVKKGEEVIFSSYEGDEVKIDGETHLLLRESDVLGLVV